MKWQPPFPSAVSVMVSKSASFSMTDLCTAGSVRFAQANGPPLSTALNRHERTPPIAAPQRMLRAARQLQHPLPNLPYLNGGTHCKGEGDDQASVGARHSSNVQIDRPSPTSRTIQIRPPTIMAMVSLVLRRIMRCPSANAIACSRRCGDRDVPFWANSHVRLCSQIEK